MKNVHHIIHSAAGLAFAVTICANALTWSASAATGSLPPPIKTSYDFTYIDIPGNQFMAPFMPTEQGNTVGFWVDDQGMQHGFLWWNGIVSEFDVPGGTYTGLTSINDHSQAIGTFVDPDGIQRAFVYNIRRGSRTLLPEISGLPGLANLAINDSGLITGSAYFETGGGVGYTWNGKTYSFFTVPGADETQGVGTQPLGMNDRGQICGQYQDAQGNVYGFVKDGNRYVTVNVPGSDTTSCFGINNQGDVVGGYAIFAPVFQEQGFILHKGRFYTFPLPGYGSLTGINDDGSVAGTYIDESTDWEWRGFIARPIGDRKD